MNYDISERFVSVQGNKEVFLSTGGYTSGLYSLTYLLNRSSTFEQQSVHVALCLRFINEFNNHCTSSADNTTGIVGGFFITLKSKSISFFSASLYRNITEAQCGFIAG